MDPHCFASDESIYPEDHLFDGAKDVTQQFDNYFAYNFYNYVASFATLLIAVMAIVLKNSLLQQFANFLAFCSNIISFVLLLLGTYWRFSRPGKVCSGAFGEKYGLDTYRFSCMLYKSGSFMKNWIWINWILIIVGCCF